MHAEIKITLKGTTAYFDVTGTPKEIAHALEHAAIAHPSLAEALALLKHGLHSCECGKLSTSECEMSCLRPPFTPIIKGTNAKVRVPTPDKPH